MIANHGLAELAGSHLWRSPDPGPSQDQYEQVAQGFVQSTSSQQRTHAPQPRGGSLSLRLYPKAKGSGCKSRTGMPLGAAQPWGCSCPSLPCSSSAQGPGQTEAAGCQRLPSSPSC